MSKIDMSTVDCLQIISRRRELWESHSDILQDRVFVNAVAQALINHKHLRDEIQEYPERLIEMCFTIVDKDKQTVPFFLNDVQRDFISRLNRAKQDYRAGRRLHMRFLILKGRQQGFTSFITAYQLASTITRKNFEGLTAADEDGNTASIFENKAKQTYNRLPELIKPSEKYNNRRQLLFDKLNSSWEVRTASKEMGRSRTVNFFHGSEVAFWKALISDIQASLGESLTKDAVIIYESTANGYNEYKDLWDSGKWENCFYEWWRTTEYRMPYESDDKRDWFERNVNSASKESDWIWQRCKWLRDVIGLDWAQVYWYYVKWDSYIDKEKIKQEYPCSDKEAFLASGRCVFDQSIIVERIETLKRQYETKKPMRGTFVFEWQDAETRDKILDDTIRFVPDDNGYITIYEDRKDGYPYVLGGDTKGDGSDYFSAAVINNVTGQRCAYLHADLDPDTYAHQVYCLGRYYNDALVGIEVNFDIYPVKELDRLRYPYQYVRQVYDKIGKKTVQRFGWKTDGNTRPLIISKQIETIRDHIELFPDVTMLDECLTFVYDEKGRPDAQPGKHDDVLFADMIASEIRGQQRYTVTGVEKPRKTRIQLDKERLAKRKKQRRLL